jgi:hypothetical protein
MHSEHYHQGRNRCVPLHAPATERHTAVKCQSRGREMQRHSRVLHTAVCHACAANHPGPSQHVRELLLSGCYVTRLHCAALHKPHTTTVHSQIALRHASYDYSQLQLLPLTQCTFMRALQCVQCHLYLQRHWPSRLDVGATACTPYRRREHGVVRGDPLHKHDAEATFA